MRTAREARQSIEDTVHRTLAKPTICKHGHTHDRWESAARCSLDSVSPRDELGRLIESPAPAEEQPAQAALNFEEGQ